ncbi:hypothetical protein [Streptomyces atratus]|uniref:hypothetical protein n=1 Tax=Streptomyces atratus TaxID=1893 RepID=UPI00366032C6
MELQKRVDRYLADWGGTQTAENEISEPGADLILALPGETVARDLSQPSSAAATCREGHFCAWKSTTSRAAISSTCTNAVATTVSLGGFPGDLDEQSDQLPAGEDEERRALRHLHNTSRVLCGFVR